MKFEAEYSKNLPEQNAVIPLGGREIEMPYIVSQIVEQSVSDAKKHTQELLNNDQELKEKFTLFLESLNITLMQDIFASYLTRAGVPKERWNFLDTNDICLGPIFIETASESNEIYGMYEPVKNLITFTPECIKQRDIVAILHGFFHEYTHAISYNRYTIDKKTKRSIHKYGKGMTGFSGIEKKNAYLESFNEGVTERICQEVLVEYLKSNAEFSGKKEGLDKVISAYTLEKEFLQYGLYIFFVESICEQIAEWAHIDKEIVWEAFVSAFLTGDSLYEENTQQLLAESIHPTFLVQLEKLSNTSTYSNLGEFAKTFSFPQIESFKEKWLAHLGLDFEPK